MFCVIYIYIYIKDCEKRRMWSKHLPGKKNLSLAFAFQKLSCPVLVELFQKESLLCWLYKCSYSNALSFCVDV